MTDTPLTAAEEFAANVEPASDALCGAAWQWFVNGPGVDNPKRPTIWALLSRIEHDRATIAALTERAVMADPEAVAHYANWPVNETDLFARHLWLVNEGQRQMRGGLEKDPDRYDAKIAGWWVWGINAWIGSGWCPGKGPWHLGDGGRGVNRQLPHLGGGRGVNRQLPHLGEYFEALAARLAKMLRERKKYPIHAVYRDSTTLDFTEVDAIATALERADRLERALEGLIEECDSTIAWRQARGMKPVTDISAFAATALSGVIATRRTLVAALATGKEGGK